MAQPILWCQHADKQRKRIRIVNGKKVTEKVPQHGHDGKDSDYDNPQLARGNRVFFGMDFAGFEVRAPITNGAADMDTSSGYARFMRAKFRHFGWVHVSECPCLLVKTGTLKPDHIADQSLLTAEACEPGQHAPTKQNPDRRCPHYLAEKAARMKRNAEEQAAMAIVNQSEIDKLVKEHREQTNTLVDVMREGFEKIAGAQPAAKGKGEK